MRIPIRTYEPRLWPSTDTCTLHVYKYLYVDVFSRQFVNDCFRSGETMRAEFGLKMCICCMKWSVMIYLWQTGLNRRTLMYEMEWIGKLQDNADVTVRIVPTTDEHWQTRNDLSESVCSFYLVLWVVSQPT